MGVSSGGCVRDLDSLVPEASTARHVIGLVRDALRRLFRIWREVQYPAMVERYRFHLPIRRPLNWSFSGIRELHACQRRREEFAGDWQPSWA